MGLEPAIIGSTGLGRRRNAAAHALAGGVRKALGLGDDADEAAILAALGNTTKKRDEAQTRANTIAAERDGERLDAEIRSALGKSGIITQNTDDAAT